MFLALMLGASFTLTEVALEGFPDSSPPWFVDFFVASHPGCTWDTIVTRIEFSYEDADPQSGTPSSSVSCSTSSTGSTALL